MLSAREVDKGWSLRLYLDRTCCSDFLDFVWGLGFRVSGLGLRV